MSNVVDGYFVDDHIFIILNCVNFCEVHGRKILISTVKRMMLASNKNAMFAVRVLEWIADSWTPYPISVH